MPRPQTTATVLRHQRVLAQVAEMEAAGLDEETMASRLGITRKLLSEYLAKLAGEYRRRATVSIDEARGKDLARIEAMTEELWRQYYASIQPATVTTQQITDDGSGGTPRRTVTKREEARTGDPRYLAEIRALMERKARLLGLDQPVEVRAILQKEQITIQRVVAVALQVAGNKAEMANAIADALEASRADAALGVDSEVVE